MFYVYIVLSAVLIPVLNRFFEILEHSYSWWLCPLLVAAFFLGFVVLHLLVAVIWISTVNLNKPPRGTEAFRKFADLTISLLLKLARVHVNIDGEDKLDGTTRMLFICNHQHDLDPIMLLYAFPNADIGFIGKKDIYTEMPFIARAMHLLNCLPIDRENDRAAAKTVIEASRMLKSGRVSVGLFPEGYTSKTCELLPFRNGAFKIAYRAEAPIVVCVVNNTRAIVKRMFRRKTEIELHVLEVLNYEDYKELSTVELGSRLHEKMKSELDKMRE